MCRVSRRSAFIFLKLFRVLHPKCKITSHRAQKKPVSKWGMCFCRFWEQFPPFPSTRPRAARSTWVRTPSAVTLSVPRALRWTSWYLKERTITWVTEIKAELILSMCAAVLTLTLFLFSFFLIQREFPVPEQFKTVWNGAKLVTEPTEIAGWLCRP